MQGVAGVEGGEGVKDKITRMGAINLVLWLAFVLAMGASIGHLAWTFGTVERPGWEFLGWIPAIAVDAGLAALAYTIQQRKKSRRVTLPLWVGVVGFAVISALANFYHALSVEGVVLFPDAIVYIKAAVLAATLPVMYIFLGEIISNDDAQMIAKAEQDEQRRINKEEREQRRLEMVAQNEQARLMLEQRRLDAEQNKQQEQATEQQQEASKERTCLQCGTTFKNRQAYAAHACMKNGKVHADVIVQ